VDVMMKQATTFDCDQCHKPIIAHESFVRFKDPGRETYQFFHWRIRAGDCWEGHLKKRK
jgi:hypothetical protein